MRRRRAITAPAGHTHAKPGATLRALRTQRGWTLAEMGRRTGFPVSTLSKMENDRVSLTYDKLMRIAAGLEVDISRLFGAQDGAVDASGLGGRRSIARAGEGKSIASRNYLHLYPHTELLDKRMNPIIADSRTHSLEEFGELLRHSGEEYVYVLEGEIDVYTSLYAPVRLRAGDSIYLDSTMAHGYVAASNRPCRVLAVMSGSEREMIAAVGSGPQPRTATTPARRPKRRRPA